MKVRFWGVRGSIATPLSPAAVEEKICRAILGLPRELDTTDAAAVYAYVRELPALSRGTAGGNTACVEVQVEGETIILDAGSGLRALGLELMRGPWGRGKGTLHLLFSHPHWDHIQGFPFFAPAFVPGNRIVIYGGHDMRAALRDQQRSPFFPVPVDYMRAGIEFVTIADGATFAIGAATITSRLHGHPGDAYSYRIAGRHSVLVYATDAEYKELDAEELQPAVAFFRGADALIFDAQYTLKDAWQKVDWGHSSAMIGVDLARAAGVKQLVLFHHDPTYSDERLHEILETALAYQAQDRSRPDCKIVVAQEGLTLDLTPPGTVDLRLLESGAAVLTPVSVLDEHSLDQLVRRLEGISDQEALASALIDLAQVETLTTPVLKALVGLGRERPSARLVLVSPSAAVQRVIKLAGYADIFAIYPSVEAALAADRLRSSLRLPGTVLKGRYRIEQAVAEYPTCTLLRATDTETDTPVAIRVLAPSFSAETIGRLQRHTHQMVSLSHPAVGKIVALEQEGTCTFLVAEWIEGETLHERLGTPDARARLTTEEALALATELAVILEYIHSHGVVHGALTSYSIVFTAGGLKLVDLGIGPLSVGRPLFDAPELVIDPAYVAPEQIAGQEIDARADLYALGMIFYQLFTGQLPFQGSDEEILLAHINQQPASPRELSRAVSLGLEHLILKLLAKHPNDRYASAHQIAEVLAGLAPGSADGGRLHDGALVSRDAQLQQLRQLWEHARAGHGRLAFISGELGIGKSRLAQELASSCGDATALTGQCREPAASGAYMPFAEALRIYLATLPPELYEEEMRPTLAILTALAPELRQLAPQIAPPPPLEPRQEQIRLMNALAHLIEQSARRRPWLLILDDLHWADEGSLELLQYLGRRLDQARLLIVGTFCDTDLELGHPLRQTLRELDRHPTYLSLALERLDVAAVRELLAQLWHCPVPLALAAQIYNHTAGNPFYVEEVARGLVDDGMVVREQEGLRLSMLEHVRLPPSMRDAVWRRIRRLNPDTQTLLRQAAVLGPTFPFKHLRAMSELPDWEVLEHLDMAIERRLVREAEGDGILCFSHTEIHQVLYADLSALRRRTLHRRAGEVIEWEAGDATEQQAAALAHHFGEAGEPARALPYALAAARQAEAACANESALYWYRSARSLLSQIDPTGDGNHQLLDILEAQARLLELVGRWPAAHDVYDQALRLAETAGDSRLLARFQAARGELLRKQGCYDEAAAWQQWALAGFQAAGDEAGIAMVRHYQGTLAVMGGDYGAAAQLYGESLRIQRALGDQDAVSRLLNNLALVAQNEGDYARAHDLYTQGLALNRAIGNQRLVALVLANLGHLAILEGDFAAAERWGTESLAVARAVGDLAYTALALGNLGGALRAQGHLARARDHYVESLSMCRDLGDRRMIAFLLEDMSQLACLQGDDKRALRLLGAAAALRAKIGAPLAPPEQEQLEQALAPAYATAGPAAAAALAAGRDMTLDQVIAYALALAPGSAGQVLAVEPGCSTDLTNRAAEGGAEG